MDVRPHPTHARTTGRLAAIFALLAVIAWPIGFFYSDGSGESVRDILLVSSILLFGTLALFVFALRAYICKCPNCERWLTKQEKVDIDEQPRRFICQHCNVSWDSKVKLG